MPCMNPANNIDNAYWFVNPIYRRHQLIGTCLLFHQVVQGTPNLGEVPPGHVGIDFCRF